MTPTEKLRAFLEAAPAVPVPPHGAEPAKIQAALELSKAKPAVHALLRTLVEKDTSFVLFDVEVYPAILARAPWKKGVMTEREIAVAKNGAGDLYLWNVDSDRVRFVDHEEDWQVTDGEDTFDAFLEQAMWSCLECIEADDLDEADEAYLGRVRFAIDLAGADALNDDARAKLEELGFAF